MLDNSAIEGCSEMYIRSHGLFLLRFSNVRWKRPGLPETFDDRAFHAAFAIYMLLYVTWSRCRDSTANTQAKPRDCVQTAFHISSGRSDALLACVEQQCAMTVIEDPQMIWCIRVR